MATVEKVRRATAHFVRLLDDALRDPQTAQLRPQITSLRATLVAIEAKLAGAEANPQDWPQERLAGVAGVIRKHFGLFMANMRTVRGEAPASPPAPVVVPEPEPVAPAPAEHVEVPVIEAVAGALAQLAEAVNPPLTSDRVGKAILAALPDARGVIEKLDGLGVFAFTSLGYADRVRKAIALVPDSQVHHALTEASLAIAGQRILALCDELSRGVIAPLAGGEDNARAIEAAEAVEAVRQNVVLAAEQQNEVDVRHALRGTALNPLLMLVRNLSTTAGAALPTATLPMDVTAPEDKKRAEDFEKATPRPATQAVGGTQISTPAPPSATAFVLWVPDIDGGGGHTAFGQIPSGAQVPAKVDAPGFLPFPTADAAKEVARWFGNAAKTLSDSGRLSAAKQAVVDKRWKEGLTAYRIEPYAPQLDPQATEDAQREDLPDSSTLSSLLNQFDVPNWYDPYGAVVPPEAKKLIRELDTRYGNYDWAPLLVEALKLRSEVVVESDAIDRCIFWTRNPGSYKQGAATVSCDMLGTKRITSEAVGGVTWYRVSMLCAEAEAQIKHWQAVAPYTANPEFGQTLSEADYKALRAGDSAGDTSNQPQVTAAIVGVFQITPAGVWIDTGLLSLLSTTRYVVTPSSDGSAGVEIHAPKGDWTLRAAEDAGHTLGSSTPPVYRLTQMNPAPPPQHELDLILAFLADVEKRGLGKRATGSLTTAEAATLQGQSNGGLTIGSLRTELLKVLVEEWVPWATDHFGVVFQPKVSMTPEALVLNLYYAPAPGDPKAPEQFGIVVHFTPQEDKVGVSVKLMIAQPTNPKTALLPLGKAMSPLVLVPLVSQLHAFRPIDSEAGKKALEDRAKEMVAEGARRAYGDKIREIAQGLVMESQWFGVRGKAIE